MRIEETYYAVLLTSVREPKKIFIAFGDGGAPRLFNKRKLAVQFKKGLVAAGCKNARVIKVQASYEFEVTR